MERYLDSCTSTVLVGTYVRGTRLTVQPQHPVFPFVAKSYRKRLALKRKLGENFVKTEKLAAQNVRPAERHCDVGRGLLHVAYLFCQESEFQKSEIVSGAVILFWEKLS